MVVCPKCNRELVCHHCASATGGRAKNKNKGFANKSVRERAEATRRRNQEKKKQVQEGESASCPR